MLPKDNRLRQEKDFKKTFLSSHTTRTDSLVLKLRQNGRAFSRFGIVISLSVARKATIRNRLRRQLSEIIRHKLKDIKPGFDVVLIIRPALIKKSFGEIEKELDTLFKKAELFANP